MTDKITGIKGGLIRIVASGVLLMMLGSAHAAERDPESGPLKVFVFAGQSNMLGNQSRVEDLPAVRQSPQQNLYYNGRAWVPLDPATIQNGKGFGPEIAFADEMSPRLGEPIGVIKVSSGGTSLAVWWNPDNPDARALYRKLLKRVTAAIDSRDIVIAGMLWMQGEADRQHILPNGTGLNVADAVQQIYDHLFFDGGVIAQCEFGPGAKPGNIHAMYAAWNRIRR